MTQNLIAAEQENDLQAQICVESPVTGALKPVVNCSEPERASQHFSEDPPPATVAALEFKVAWLLNDRHSSIDWPGHGNLVVNAPGELKKKYETLCRIAKAHFPSRGDTIDVLNKTIDDYGLGGWANPYGFWTAFKRDMMDAAKKGVEAKCVPLEEGSRTSSDGIRSRNNCHEWKPSEGARDHEKRQVEQWFARTYSEINTIKIPATERWKKVLASGHSLDRLVAEAHTRVLADKDAMEEITSSEREIASLTPVVREIRVLANCSKAQAYRILEKFRKRWADGATEKLRRTRYFREKGPPSVAMPIGPPVEHLSPEVKYEDENTEERQWALLATV
jgi:hypothetical protein